MVTHLALNKKLIIDIAIMRKKPIVAIYIDTMNCYVREVYPFTSLLVQYFRLEVPYLLVLLRTIQIIKILLYILFGVSERFCSRDNGKLF